MLVFVVGLDEVNQIACVGISRHDGNRSFAIGIRVFGDIEAKVGFAGLFVRTMALKALAGQNRQDFTPVIDARFCPEQEGRA